MVCQERGWEGEGGHRARKSGSDLGNTEQVNDILAGGVRGHQDGGKSQQRTESIGWAGAEPAFSTRNLCLQHLHLVQSKVHFCQS